MEAQQPTPTISTFNFPVILRTDIFASHKTIKYRQCNVKRNLIKQLLYLFSHKNRRARAIITM